MEKGEVGITIGGRGKWIPNRPRVSDSEMTYRFRGSAARRMAIAFPARAV